MHRVAAGSGNTRTRGRTRRHCGPGFGTRRERERIRQRSSKMARIALFCLLSALVILSHGGLGECAANTCPFPGDGSEEDAGTENLEDSINKTLDMMDRCDLHSYMHVLPSCMSTKSNEFVSRSPPNKGSALRLSYVNLIRHSKWQCDRSFGARHRIAEPSSGYGRGRPRRPH